MKIQDGRDLDLSGYPTLRRLAAYDRVHVHTEAGDEEGCESCAVERELLQLLRSESLACYHIAKETLHWGPTVQRIAERWEDGGG